MLQTAIICSRNLFIKPLKAEAKIKYIEKTKKSKNSINGMIIRIEINC